MTMGASSNDGITIDPTLVGRIENDELVFGLTVEFDYDGDFEADGSAPMDENGYFAFLPDISGVGAHAIQARAKEWDYAAEEYIYGDWVDLPTNVQLASAGAAPVVAELELLNDTRESGVDGRTIDARLAGQVTNDTGVFNLLVEFDLDGDGLADGSTTTDGDGRFVFAPVGLQPADDITVKVRVIEHDPLLGVELVSSWASLTFDLLAPSTAAATILDIGLREDTGLDDEDSVTANPTLIGHVASAGPLFQVTVEFDHDNDGVVDGIAAVSDDGAFTYTPGNLSLGAHTLRLRTARYNAVSGEVIRSTGWPESITFTLDAGDESADVSTFSLLKIDRVESGVTYTYDPSVKGTITNDGSVSFVLVEFDWTEDEEADGSTYTDALGNFVFRPTGLPSTGAVVLSARVVEKTYPNGTRAGAWSDPLEYTLEAAPPGSPPENPFEESSQLRDVATDVLATSDEAFGIAIGAAVTAVNTAALGSSTSSTALQTPVGSLGAGVTRGGAFSAITSESGYSSQGIRIPDFGNPFSLANGVPTDADTGVVVITTAASGESGDTTFSREETTTYRYQSIVNETTGAFTIIVSIETTFTISDQGTRMVIAGASENHGYSFRQPTYEFSLTMDGSYQDLGGGDILVKGQLYARRAGRLRLRFLRQ
ncbi:MAG: hypothetical protein U1D30_07020 [Planctomycetota bacterium]